MVCRILVLMWPLGPLQAVDWHPIQAKCAIAVECKEHLTFIRMLQILAVEGAHSKMALRNKLSLHDLVIPSYLALASTSRILGT